MNPLAALKDSLRRLGVDRAVAFAVSARAWQFLSGPVTWYLIARFFDETTQGFFYTFSAILALQWFVELSLHVVLINFASHEWAHCTLERDGTVTGQAEARARLASLLRLVARWYAVASVLFIALAGAVGWLVLSRGDDGTVNWETPWFALVTITGVLLWTLPFASILEGCQQVATVNRYRLIQVMAGSLAVWACLAGGAGLWTAAASYAVRLFVEVVLLAGRYGAFFRSLLAVPDRRRMNWRVEIWPLQWKLALQGIVQYVAFYLFTPVIFWYHGPGPAGQLGMTWQVMTAVQAAAIAWVQTRISEFGGYVAHAEFKQLDRRFRHLSLTSLILLLLAVAGICVFFTLLPRLEPHVGIELSDRVLSPGITAVFAVGIVLFHLPQCISIYFLAHKENPHFVLSLIANSLTGLLVWLLGREYGSLGAAAAYSGVIAALTFPGWCVLWVSFRRQREVSQPDSEGNESER